MDYSEKITHATWESQVTRKLIFLQEKILITFLDQTETEDMKTVGKEWREFTGLRQIKKCFTNPYLNHPRINHIATGDCILKRYLKI